MPLLLVHDEPWIRWKLVAVYRGSVLYCTLYLKNRECHGESEKVMRKYEHGHMNFSGRSEVYMYIRMH